MRENPWARGVLWLIAGILCWCGARGALSAREGLWNKGRVSYRNPGAATTAEGVQKLRKEMKKEDGGLVAGWGQQLSQFVSAPETNGSNAVDVLWTEGDAALVWDVRMLQGNLPRQGDANGCALDAHTALKLFGSCDIVGRSVKIADQWMEIRGVFALPEGLSVMGADPGRGLAFAPAVLAPGGVAMTAIEFILYIGQESPVSQVSGWMRAAGISTGGDFDTHADERGLLSLLMDVPAYMLGLCILLELYAGGAQIGKKCLKRQRLLRENRLTPARAWLRLFSVYGAGAICLLGFAALVAALMPSIRSIPPSYLPTRWSDLSFWPGLAEKGLQSWAQTALTVSLRPDMVFRTLTAWAVGLLPASVFCLWRGRSLMLRNKGAVKP
ncbi:MAG: ABC transporter permease, partial [Firmicutes bacterium]|nr:ABC transporter permease [Bacillota bacterium]